MSARRHFSLKAKPREENDMTGADQTLEKLITELNEVTGFYSQAEPDCQGAIDDIALAMGLNWDKDNGWVIDASGRENGKCCKCHRLLSHRNRPCSVQ